MAKHGKKYLEAASKVEERLYQLDEAVAVAKESAYAKFDESLEMALRLGVDPRHADQMVRGTVVLPHGTGKSSRVVVFATAKRSRRPRTLAPMSLAGTIWPKRSMTGGSISKRWCRPPT